MRAPVFVYIIEEVAPMLPTGAGIKCLYCRTLDLTRHTNDQIVQSSFQVKSESKDFAQYQTHADMLPKRCHMVSLSPV